MVFAKVKLVKAKNKNNITASISKKEDSSFKSWNFTGSLIELEGFVTKDGVNYDKELVEIDCPTTIILYKENIGNEVYQRCAEIFEERAAIDDINPAVDLIVEVKTVRPKETNILLVNIKSIYVDNDTQIIDTSERIDSVITKLKANSEQKAIVRKSQTSAARAGLTGLASKIIKTYL